MEPTETPPPSSRWSFTTPRWRTYFLRLALELVIVFAGVYAASAFSDLQKRREAEGRRHQIRQALIREIQSITTNTRRAGQGVRRALAEYDTLIKLKRYPRLDPYLEPVKVESHMWNATLQSGALDLFDVPTVYALSNFYNQLNGGFALLDQLRELSERLLVPMAGSPPSEYYDLATGRLRPKYRWYFSQQQDLAETAEHVTELGDSLVVMLRRQEDGVVADTTTTR